MMTKLAPLAALLIAAALFIGAADAATQLQPADPQPDPASLKKGLAVEYYYDDWRDQSLSARASRGGGEVGPPLPQLKYRSGTGRVLTSDSSDFVGAKITGYMLFTEPGTYILRLTSNDGVRLTIGNAFLFEDYPPHPDSDSPPLEVTVTEPGYYRIHLLYYERKRTSTLILAWKTPGALSFEPVPPEAFWH